jgi:hypothetical protein
MMHLSEKTLADIMEAYRAVLGKIAGVELEMKENNISLIQILYSGSVRCFSVSLESWYFPGPLVRPQLW